MGKHDYLVDRLEAVFEEYDQMPGMVMAWVMEHGTPAQVSLMDIFVAMTGGPYNEPSVNPKNVPPNKDNYTPLWLQITALMSKEREFAEAISHSSGKPIGQVLKEHPMAFTDLSNMVDDAFNTLVYYPSMHRVVLEVLEEATRERERLAYFSNAVVIGALTNEEARSKIRDGTPVYTGEAGPVEKEDPLSSVHMWPTDPRWNEEAHIVRRLRTEAVALLIGEFMATQSLDDVLSYINEVENQEGYSYWHDTFGVFIGKPDEYRMAMAPVEVDHHYDGTWVLNQEEVLKDVHMYLHDLHTQTPPPEEPPF